MTTDSKENGDKPFWKSTKFVYALIAVAAFLALALTGTMTFTSDETIKFLLGVFGINVSAHALTNISAIVGQFFGRGGTVTPLAAATEELSSEANITVDAKDEESD